MESKEVLSAMTPTPWKITDTTENDFQHEIIGAHVSFGVAAIYTDKYAGEGHSTGNAHAIVSAVNATYGAGIDPAAVKDLLEALKGFYNDIDGHPSSAAREHYKSLMESAKAAISKATLKP